MYSNLRRTKGREASVSRDSSCAFEKWMPFNRRLKSIWAKALVRLLSVVISIQSLRCIALVHSHAQIPVWPYTAWRWVRARGSCTSAQVSSPLKRAGICNMHLHRPGAVKVQVRMCGTRDPRLKKELRSWSLRKTYACIFRRNRAWLCKFVSLNDIDLF